MNDAGFSQDPVALTAPVKSVILKALYDEYHAEAVYAATLEKFGADVRPFCNIINTLIPPTLTNAEDAMIHFSLSDQSRWAYFSDQVMGGVSEGRVAFEQIDNQSVLRLTGMVSTANRGGFIQARTKLDAPLPASVQGVILNVRGNNQTYFVHLRTKWTILPWQFYQASFEVSDTWEEVRIPFDDFAPQGRLLATAFDVGAVRSLAIAAFGRDHSADLTVRAVGFY